MPVLCYASHIDHIRLIATKDVVSLMVLAHIEANMASTGALEHHYSTKAGFAGAFVVRPAKGGKGILLYREPRLFHAVGDIQATPRDAVFFVKGGNPAADLLGPAKDSGVIGLACKFFCAVKLVGNFHPRRHIIISTESLTGS